MQENPIETRFRALEQELAGQAPQGGVALLAVSKTFGIEAVEAAFPGYPIHADPLSLSVACHIGPGAQAVTVTKALDSGKPE